MYISVPPSTETPSSDEIPASNGPAGSVAEILAGLPTATQGIDIGELTVFVEAYRVDPNVVWKFDKFDDADRKKRFNCLEVVGRKVVLNIIKYGCMESYELDLPSDITTDDAHALLTKGLKDDWTKEVPEGFVWENPPTSGEERAEFDPDGGSRPSAEFVAQRSTILRPASKERCGYKFLWKLSHRSPAQPGASFVVKDTFTLEKIQKLES